MKTSLSKHDRYFTCHQWRLVIYGVYSCMHRPTLDAVTSRTSVIEITVPDSKKCWNYLLFPYDWNQRQHVCSCFHRPSGDVVDYTVVVERNAVIQRILVSHDVDFRPRFQHCLVQSKVFADQEADVVTSVGQTFGNYSE